MDEQRLKKISNRLNRDQELGELAIKNSEARRYYEEEDNKKYQDTRPPFFRDVDRIVHSKAYSRYIDKTQVFYEINNANITHRSLHVILVSRISRHIGRILKLNTDLIEAISLGHDVGHTPYGHLGEEILSNISAEEGIGRFNHNAQGIRWLFYLEKRFPKKPANGLNLTLQVLDGVLCHDGEIHEQVLKPKKINGKTWDDFFDEFNDCSKQNTMKLIPMSYEGIVVRFADTISYIGRDIEDAILLKLIDREEIPEFCKNILGDTNRKIIDTLIMDLIDYSMDNKEIGYSKEIFEALKKLKEFNYEKIYKRRDLYVREGSDKPFHEELKEKFEVIYTESMKDLKNENFDSPIFMDHIEYIDDNSYSTYYYPLKKSGELALIVRDYIAGMSDKYFLEIYNHTKICG
ncbi:MAG: deoxyguanosinetriphosphate triphosphohydrolase family protein [Promethearchaeia archaeon]